MLRKIAFPVLILLLSLFGILLQSFPCEAGWLTAYGGTGVDSAYSVQQTTDGGYIVTGTTSSYGAGSGDVWVLKLDEDGNVTWQKTYGGSGGREWANSIQQTPDGGYIMAGMTASFGAGSEDVWVLKLDKDGNVTWQKTYGGATSWDYANSVQQTSDGGYIVAGFTRSFGAGNGDAWVLKLDADGAVVWQKTYGGAESDTAGFAQEITGGGYIVAGYTRSSGAGEGDAWVLKLDADGNVIWQKTYGGTGNDFATFARQTTDGGYIVGAGTASSGAGEGDAWVLKLDADGNVIWQKTYGGADDDNINSIQQTTDGGYVVAGSTKSFGRGLDDAWVFKLDGNGNVTWQKVYGASDSDAVFSIQQTTDGGYIVGGSSNNFGAGAQAALLMKLDGRGSTGSCPFEKSSTAKAANTSVTGTVTSVVPDTPLVLTSNTSVVPTDSSVTPRIFCPLSSKAPSLNVGLTRKHQGDGRITSDDGFIYCPADCKTKYSPGSIVTLSATPASFSTFLGWSPSSLGCLTTDPCQVTMDKTTSVKAIFQGPSKLKVGTLPRNKGEGTVKSGDGLIVCPGTCEQQYLSGAAVSLEATPAALSTFVKWSGTPCDKVSSNVCTFNMDKDYTVKPMFQGPNKLKVSITSKNGGTGTVSSADSFINCPGDCEESYPVGAPVSLTATGATGTALKWSGTPCAHESSNTCTFTMDKAYTVNAIFQAP